MHEVKIVADSINPCGVRITTWLARYPEYLHAEHLRHREQSFCVASNRAIPTKKQIERMLADNFCHKFMKNRPGMQSTEELEWNEQFTAEKIHEQMRQDMLHGVERLQKLNIHKQYINRYMMPFKMLSVLFTATRFDNFFALRAHPAAEPVFRGMACDMVHQYYNTEPEPLEPGQWHLPFVTKKDKLNYRLADQQIISVASCARTSYENHEGVFSMEDNEKLYNMLKNGSPPHASPFEHQAVCRRNKRDYRNFQGWQQLRTFIPNDTTKKFDYEDWKLLGL